MRRKTINIPLYNYRVTLLDEISESDADALRVFLKRRRLPDDMINDVVGNVSDGAFDGGYTISNMSIKELYVVLLACSNDDVRRRVLGHERRHVEDDVLEHCGINDKEAAAYLSGYLSQHMK